MDDFRPRGKVKIGKKSKYLIIVAFSSNATRAKSVLFLSALLIGGNRVTTGKFLETHSF